MVRRSITLPSAVYFCSLIHNFTLLFYRQCCCHSNILSSHLEIKTITSGALIEVVNALNLKIAVEDSSKYYGSAFKVTTLFILPTRFFSRFKYQVLFHNYDFFKIKLSKKMLESHLWCTDVGRCVVGIWHCCVCSFNKPGGEKRNVRSMK